MRDSVLLDRASLYFDPFPSLLGLIHYMAHQDVGSEACLVQMHSLPSIHTL